MTRKVIFIISGILLFGSAAILFLFYRTGENIKYSQQFIRFFPKEKFLKKEAQLSLSDDKYYIAGADMDHIYLGNTKSRLAVFMTDKKLTGFKAIRIEIGKYDSSTFENSRIQIDSPYFYIKDGRKPAVYKGLISDWKANLFVGHRVKFDQATPVSNKIAIQTTVTEEGKNVYKKMLGLIQMDSPYVRIEPNLLENQIDGYFSTSGTLRYSKSMNRLVYTYHYRNLYQVMDTNLTIIDKGHTIDSISKIKIRPIQVYKNVLTLASPPAIVNLNTQLSKNLLFVQSNLMGNERRSDFDRSSVIDVYSLSSNSYLASFYIPDHEGSKIETFFISNHSIYVTFKSSIHSYSIKSLLDENIHP